MATTHVPLNQNTAKTKVFNVCFPPRTQRRKLATYNALCREFSREYADELWVQRRAIIYALQVTASSHNTFDLSDQEIRQIPWVQHDS
jgi:hypothetical protein